MTATMQTTQSPRERELRGHGTRRYQLPMHSDSTKLCECGCGQPAPIATYTIRSQGYVKGQHVRFISGHNSRGRKATDETRARISAALTGRGREHKHGEVGRFWNGCRCVECKAACRAYNRAYYEENRQRLIDRSADFYRENRDEVLVNARAYREQNAERIRAYDRAYYAANRERWRGHKQRRIARKKQTLHWAYTTASRIAARFAYYGNRCRWCGAVECLQVDHVIPLALGGSHLPANIVPACGRCNRAKSAKSLAEWLEHA